MRSIRKILLINREAFFVCCLLFNAYALLVVLRLPHNEQASILREISASLWRIIIIYAISEAFYLIFVVWKMRGNYCMAGRTQQKAFPQIISLI
jgi:hypothetical protein